MAVTISIAITQNSQNAANKTSNVTVAVSAHWTYGSWNATGECYGYLTIDGTKYTFTKITFNKGQSTNGSEVIMEKTVNVIHDSDGSKILSCSASFYTGLSGSGTQTASASKVLDPIQQASQPSLVTWPESTANVGDFGETFSIHMNRKSDSFTHTVRYEYGNRTGTIATKVGTGTTWAVPLSFMNDIPNATRASGRIYVDTYDGSALIGTRYTGFTVTVPASVKPGLTVALEDITGVDDIYGSPVKGLSRIKITPTITPAYSSEIASCTITANGATYNATSATTGFLATAGSSKVTVTVKDKRGRTNSWSYTMTVLDYSAPTVSALSVHRCDADGTENDQGEYIEVIFSAAISSMSGKNTAAFALKYKKSTAASYTTATLNILANAYAVTNYSYIFKADESSSYNVEVTATDRHSSAGRATSASTAFSLMDLHPSGTGVRWGGVAELENTFQNDLELKQVGNSYAFQPGSFSGAKGYTLLAVVTIDMLNVNAPIVFEINRRGATCPMRVFARFASSSDTTDPDLASFTYEGDNYGAFMVKAAESTWKLYVDNTGGWSNPCLQKWYTTSNQRARIAIDFPDEQVAGTDPSVLGTYYRAIPVIPRSILDSFMPVGFILTLYSHADPNTMYPGTTWVRMENTFLWGIDDKGSVGLTGGTKDVTLTVDQIPSHSHGSVYSGNVSGTKTHAWLASGGSAMAYGTVAAGGGKSHTNMPPYTQVSIWRRTA